MSPPSHGPAGPVSTFLLCPQSTGIRSGVSVGMSDFYFNKVTGCREQSMYGRSPDAVRAHTARSVNFTSVVKVHAGHRPHSLL